MQITYSIEPFKGDLAYSVWAIDKGNIYAKTFPFKCPSSDIFELEYDKIFDELHHDFYENFNTWIYIGGKVQ